LCPLCNTPPQGKPIRFVLKSPYELVLIEKLYISRDLKLTHPLRSYLVKGKE
jgi:hypothetical protein